jgi:hypothetical protein
VDESIARARERMTAESAAARARLEREADAFGAAIVERVLGREVT